MYTMRLFPALLCLTLFSVHVGAQNLSLQNLDANSFNQVVGDLSTNFLHTSVSGASPLGHIFGFELGVVAGQTKTSHLNSVVQQTDPNATADKVPGGELIGLLTVPFGLTAELGLVPKVGSQNFKFNSTALAVKWTPTELFGDLPVSLAAKLSYTKSTLNFTQMVNSNNIDYTFDDGETALTLLVSKNLALIEPYFGIGTVTAKGDLNANGPVNLFNYTTSNSASATRTGTMWMVGTEVKLLVVKLGVEYTNLFDTGRFTGKLSFYF